ncbi:hypothetical protein [Bacillus sp. JCM 19034]|uniref:TcaA NTF2-like domain-containing protein n=1 Tax=Bacillus sp. JCM 19034 TaxID=1481928 RepID=UPI000782F90B|nr:hypothetical protein [Bacillus sp. JCM 19034]
MKVVKWLVFISFLILVACQSPDPLSLTLVENDEELVEFVTDYKKAMVDSVNNGHINDVEPFLMENVSFYHSLRRYVDDLHSNGAKKSY